MVIWGLTWDQTVANASPVIPNATHYPRMRLASLFGGLFWKLNPLHQPTIGETASAERSEV